MSGLSGLEIKAGMIGNLEFRLKLHFGFGNGISEKLLSLKDGILRSYQLSNKLGACHSSAKMHLKINAKNVLTWCHSRLSPKLKANARKEFPK